MAFTHDDELGKDDSHADADDAGAGKDDDDDGDRKGYDDGDIADVRRDYLDDNDGDDNVMIAMPQCYWWVRRGIILRYSLLTPSKFMCAWHRNCCSHCLSPKT